MLAALTLSFAVASCDDNKSYSELLTDENHYVNNYLADQRVIGEVPADSVFETGPDAPYYQMDEDGNVYMQVVDPGNMKQRPAKDDRVYFRFTRYNLSRYETGKEMTGAGNSDDVAGENGLGALYFIFDNYNAGTSSQYGAGIQIPMRYLGADAKVNLVVKSQYGFSNEIANVIPFLYEVSYYESPLFPWVGED